ncbi:hypothetical protein NFI96_015767 [Prochilodus magdalenae]|nr:hypothetical protein NFI96_015767 [Prochilodus magdalenae]
MCGCCMRSALLALSPNSDPRPADQQAQKLAQQISFKAESSTSSSVASGGQVLGTDSKTDQQEESSTSEAQDSETTPQAEPAESVPASSSEAATVPPAPGTRPLSPRQRRAQNQNRNQNQNQLRRPAFPAFPAAAAQPDGSHTGSAVLIVLLTLALAALVFRRIYLAQEYKFDYEL